MNDQAQNPGGGPLPRLPAGAVETIHLGQGDMGDIPIRQPLKNLLAFGLFTCAGVVVASTQSTRIAVYHAPSGSLSVADVNAMRNDIGNPPWASMVAVYAVLKPWDTNYNNDAMNLQNAGIPANQVAWIQNLPSVQFGVNSNAQIGT